MACENLLPIQLRNNESEKFTWKSCIPPENKITCGMLPTLQVLASRGCECQGAICLVPLLDKMDSASHIQMTLLEAYCREIDIKVVRISIESLRTMLGPEHHDLSCVLMTHDSESYFLESPE